MDCTTSCAFVGERVPFSDGSSLSESLSLKESTGDFSSVPVPFCSGGVVSDSSAGFTSSEFADVVGSSDSGFSFEWILPLLDLSHQNCTPRMILFLILRDLLQKIKEKRIEIIELRKEHTGRLLVRCHTVHPPLMII